MEVRQLTSFISTSPQITAADAGLAASRDFTVIISNRPNQESEDQPSNDEIHKACELHGIEWHCLPVVSGQITDEDIVAFRQLMIGI